MEKKIRLINANDCPTLFEEKYKKTSQLILQGETHLDSLAEGFTEAHNIILTMPTVDAVVVVHGYWMYSGEPDDDMNVQAHCSVCGAGDNHAASMIGHVPYCWQCGAKMDLEAPHD